MDETSRPRSRRWFLAGGLAVVAGAGAGVGAEYLRDESPPLPPPAVLVQAAAAERALIADLTATTGGTPEVRLVIEQARADHQDPTAALATLASAYRKAPAND